MFLYVDNSRVRSGIRTDLGFGSLADRHQSGSGRWVQLVQRKQLGGIGVRLSGDWDISHNDNGELIEKEVRS